MSVRKCVGGLLVASPFIAFLVFLVIDEGVLATLGFVVAVAAMFGVIALGVELLVGDD